MAHRWTVLLVATLLGGCITSDAQTCANGLVCPAGTVCSPITVECLLPQQVATCEGRANEFGCEFGGVQGLCRDGVCFEIRCGDGFVTAPEVCDDGNEEDGDNCSADCSSSLACGNGVVDPMEECDCGAEGVALPDDCILNNSADDDRAKCNTECQLRCGDGEVSGYENCDTDPPPGDCLALGFQRGRAECTSECSLDFADCDKFGLQPEVTGPGYVGINMSALEFSGTGTVFAFGLDDLVGGLSYMLVQPVGGQLTVTPLDGYELYDVAVVDDNLAIAVGVYGSTEGLPRGATVIYDGSTWEPMDPEPFDQFGLISAVWAGSATDMVVATLTTGADGLLEFDGASWTPVSSLGIVQIRDIAATGVGDDLVGVGDDGDVVYRTNGVWTQGSIPGLPTLYAVSVLAPDNIVAVGEGGDIYRFDGDWSRDSSNTTVTLLDVQALSATDVYATGPEVTVHFDGTGWFPLSVDAPLYSLGERGSQAYAGSEHLGLRHFAEPGWGATALGILIGPNTSVLHGHGDEVYFGHNTLLYKWDRKTLSVIGSFDIPAGLFARGKDDFFVFRYGEVYHSSDLNAAIESFEDTSVSVVGVWADASRIYIASSKASVHDDTDVGPGFVARAVGLASGDGFVALGGVEGGPVYALSRFGSVWQNVAGSWQHIGDVGAAGSALWASSDGVVFVGGDLGLLWRWDGQAFDPAPMDIATDQRITAIHGSSSTDVFATTVSGLFHYDGYRWSPVQGVGTTFTHLYVTANDAYFLDDTTEYFRRLSRPTAW